MTGLLSVAFRTLILHTSSAVGKRIKRLEPPDSHHLLAAQGWLELGSPIEANEELEQIAPQLRAHPDVLEIRWQIYAKEKKWEACVDVAAAIVQLTRSGRKPGFTDLSPCMS